jgi:hypothetical protein
LNGAHRGLGARRLEGLWPARTHASTATNDSNRGRREGRRPLGRRAASCVDLGAQHARGGQRRGPAAWVFEEGDVGPVARRELTRDGVPVDASSDDSNVTAHGPSSSETKKALRA